MPLLLFREAICHTWLAKSLKGTAKACVRIRNLLIDVVFILWRGQHHIGIPRAGPTYMASKCRFCVATLLLNLHISFTDL